jgi:hypothetical protein
VAVGLFALILTIQTLADAERLVGVYRPMNLAMVVAVRARARRDPLGPVGLRRQPLPQR